MFDFCRYLDTNKKRRTFVEHINFYCPKILPSDRQILRHSILNNLNDAACNRMDDLFFLHNNTSAKERTKH